ncbi:MAG TPA: DegQ family serine endoprotease [Rhodocyclaceae bacterium]
MQRKSLSLTAAVVSLALAGGYIGFAGQPATGATAAIPQAATPAESGGMPASALPDFSGIVARNGPAVVNISVTGTLKNELEGGGHGGSPQMDPDDPMAPFFKHFQIVPHENIPVHSLGSGFIISADGLVLTDAHVIDDADEVIVKLTDKREFKAKVLGTDKLTDVAVLRIPASNLPVVHMGDPASTRVGEWVLAIGSPFGFENSVTAGIVSAKGRSLPDDSYVPFIQTDAAVNPGNSGGPLFNLRGEVIGINSQIYSRSGGYQGVSFAIPIDVAMRVEEQLVQHGRVEHARLGVSIQEVSQPLAESFGLKRAEGALVGSVEKGSPAAKAGLQPGDIILKLNGTPIGRSAELPPLVAAMRPGTRVSLEVWRKGERREVGTTLAELKPQTQTAAAPSEDNSVDKGRLGLAVRPLTPEESKQVDVPGGLVIQQATGAAARAGLQPDDIVLSFNGEPVKSIAQLRSLVAKAGKHAALLIERDGAKIFVPVDLG